MYLKLGHILAGEGAWAGKPKHQAAINDLPTCRFTEPPQRGRPGLGQCAGQRFDGLSGRWTGNPHHCNPCSPHAAGNREDRVSSTTPSSFPCFFRLLRAPSVGHVDSQRSAGSPVRSTRNPHSCRPFSPHAAGKREERISSTAQSASPCFFRLLPAPLPVI